VVPKTTFSKGNASTLDFAATQQQLTTLSGDVAAAIERHRDRNTAT
jgi:hypothetical protein